MKKAESIGLGVFTLIYFMLLLNAVYQGVETAVTAFFYAIGFLFTLVILFIMLDRFDITITGVDAQVIASTVVACIVVLALVGFPSMKARVMEITPTVLSSVGVDKIFTTFFFVATTESMFKYVIIQSVHQASPSDRGWIAGILLASTFFSVLHGFRYGFFTGTMFFTLMMGIILLFFARLPHILGSKIELSLWPMLVAHFLFNVLVQAGGAVLVM